MCFSPSVFAQGSTPKTDGKFKWTIDDISSLKPADIDEATVSQHVNEQDPTKESLMQQKIDRFFNEKAVVPSPFTEPVKYAPMVDSPKRRPSNETVAVQTLLSLPPILPKHIQEALAPYFTYPELPEHDTSLYKQLFEFEDDRSTTVSSPALSTGLSPIQYSPEFIPSKGAYDSTIDIPELRECTLSPIGRSSPQSRSACRLDFSNNSNHMSVDKTFNLYNEDKRCSPPLKLSNDSSTNWDLEYKQISMLSRSPISSPELQPQTPPPSKSVVSQRKRLSEQSFTSENAEDIEMEDLKRSRSQLTDTGYITGENSSSMFASTPTKF